MAVIPKTDPSPAYLQAVEEITRAYKSLPPRPTIEEVEAATSVLHTVNTSQHTKLEEISSQPGPRDVPPELFSVLQQVRTTQVLFHAHEQRKEAAHLVETDEMFRAFDELIQRASDLVLGVKTQVEERVLAFENEVMDCSLGDPVGEIIASGIEMKRIDGGKGKVVDGGGLKGLVVSSSFKGRLGGGDLKGLVGSSSFRGKLGGGDLKGLVGSSVGSSSFRGKLGGGDLKGLVGSSSTNKPTSFITGGGDTEKLSLMKVAAIIENSAKNGDRVLDLQGKLMEKIEWLPVSLGKLSNVYELNLSQNHIMALPATIGSLLALTKLDIHSNQLINLPESFGELVNLTDLDLHANMLKSLPPSFGDLNNLSNLDLSSNHFTHLPDLIGKLTSLKKLNVETNELEELPFSIGSCSSIVELRLDFNQLKALPEAIGKLEGLEILSLHYNKVKRLPTTIGNLSKLREVDISFNELESIPESLCAVVSIVKLNVGHNFADLRALPKSIGNLEMLEELDISDDQIRVLPESFRFLSKLRVFRADETPLEVPPRQIIKLGAQAVVEYMAEFVAKKDLKFQQPKKKKGFWSRVCLLFRK
ncbi:hypothetical protein RHSIM_Rhsim07G0125000 [Rhododendron simsii]|uniref:Disease resistance R13L4/SHOC-2-like LRR domain-containing protein n=1 Tax=Rhododendron simsii TaxID=118357 RepID=A0A834GPI9_RHOSS|nr:hypothetical protein RHSIM_Rhsim07G0125000 [Rhododendron simsii]